MKPLKVGLSNLLIKDRELCWIFLLFASFFLLRLYHLGYHDLWYDEIATVNYAQHPWHNWNAPLYWILMHLWIKIFGISEFSLRFPSAIFNFFAVILTFLIGKRLFNKKIGIIASFFIGLSPFHLWYAQEARDYSMVLFWGILSTYLLIKALEVRKLKSWLFFACASVAGLYTNYFYIFLFLAQLAYILFFERRKLSLKEIFCFLSIVIIFMPYLPRFLSKFYTVWYGFWIFQPRWQSLLITLQNFSLGYNGSSRLYFISNLMSVIFFISALWSLHRRELRKPFTFCFFLFFLPIIFAFFFSRIFFSVYLDRGLIIFSPYYYLILSVGAVSLNRYLRFFLIGIYLPLILICGYNYFRDWMVMPLEHHTGTYIKKPIKPIVEFLTDAVDPNEDILAFTNPSVMPAIKFYTKKRLPIFYYFFDPRFPDTSWQRPIIENKYNVQLYKISKLEFKRLWVIACDWARSGELDKNSQAVKDWLDKSFTLEFTRKFQGLWIYGYIKNEIR